MIHPIGAFLEVHKAVAPLKEMDPLPASLDASDEASHQEMAPCKSTEEADRDAASARRRREASFLAWNSDMVPMPSPT